MSVGSLSPRYAPVSTPASGGHHDPGCCASLLGDEPEEDYLYVGPGRGHFEESVRGNFHYVGRNGGRYELRRKPPPKHCRRICITTTLVVIAAGVIAFVLWATFFSPSPEFDCYAGLENSESGWSAMKKEYCCENEGIGCTTAPAGETPPHDRVPLWLSGYLGDTSLGLKFALSSIFFLLFGCCCGVCMLHQLLLRYSEKPRSYTEAEWSALISKYLKRLSASSGDDGLLSVTLMWDTVDDVDLHLKLPKDMGEISCEKPEVHGGKLEVDGNYTLDLGTTLPLEHIVWPAPKPEPRATHPSHRQPLHPYDAPPDGKYGVFAKVYSRYQHERDINITVQICMRGQRPILVHQRIVGTAELKVCEFTYKAPPMPTR